MHSQTLNKHSSDVNSVCECIGTVYTCMNSWKEAVNTTVLPRSIAPRFITNLAYRQNSRLSWFPSLKIPRYTAKLSYRHPPQVFRHKSCKTNLNSHGSTAHNYLLTAVYWSVIMECQDWSLDMVIDLIVECRNRWVVLIRIITCTMYLLF
jgi:hypothetical protein